MTASFCQPFGAVEAREVTKIYGRHRAVFRVNVGLRPGRALALLGPNGAGKTTLLWMFSTLVRPTKGTLHFGGIAPERASLARRHVGLVSHEPLSYGELTALENVAFFGRLYGLDDPKSRAEALLDELGLGHAMHRLARAFSRGMRQRLGLARALIGQPALLLLDEPFSGLDRASIETVVRCIGALRDQGAMVLMVSHDMDTAALLADETVVLNRGQVVAAEDGAKSAKALRAFYREAIASSQESTVLPKGGTSRRAMVGVNPGSQEKWAEADGSLPRVLLDAWTVFTKDLQVERRSWEVVHTTGYFAFLVVLIFAFSFFHGGAPIAQIASGSLWVALVFSGTLGLSRIFEREREGQCIRALLLAPMVRPALFLGKLLGVLAFMGVMEGVVVAAVFFFFPTLQAEWAALWRLGLTLSLGTFGYATVGTLLSAMLLRARSKDVLLAIVLYPMVLPVLIVGVKASAALLDPASDLGDFVSWVRVLAFFDIVFFIASLWIFESLVVE